MNKLFTVVTVTSDQNRYIHCAVAVGKQEDDQTELNLLGFIQAEDEEYTFSGKTWLKEDRESPQIELVTGDCGPVSGEAALDILHAIFRVLDTQEGGIIDSEHERLCPQGR